MSTEYLIEPAGSQFLVIDPNGDQVNACASEEAAKREILLRYKAVTGGADLFFILRAYSG